MKVAVWIFIALLAIVTKCSAQHGINDTIKTYAYVDKNGDTLSLQYLETVQVSARMPEKWKRYWTEWTRLRNAVYVTYPYAKSAGKIMKEINAKLVNVTDKKQRKAIIHSKEAELRKEFTSKLSNLSVYQGKVLMKLIYRETGNNCYEIIEEFKGNFTAAAYQSVLFFFGSSLKQYYDPIDKDKVMELIVKDVEKMYGYRNG